MACRVPQFPPRQPMPALRRPVPPRGRTALALALALAAALSPAPAAAASAHATAAPPAAPASTPPLPPAPDLSGVPRVFDHLPLKFRVPGVAGAHVQVADDAAFQHVQYDQRIDPGDDVYIPQLADGRWHLRVRGISPEGLEGPGAVRDFQLRARPEAPFLVEPPGGAKLPVGDVTLRWTHNPDASTFVVEVARDARFTQLAQSDARVRGDAAVFHPTNSAFGAADGLYWWRVASVAADGRRGAWSEPQALVLRPAPRAPLGQVSPDGAAIELRWGGRPEDRAEAELASDGAFRQVVVRGDYDTPGARLERPAPGIYFARYRFVEPDGFKTAWSAPVRIEVERSWHQALRALLPASWLR